MVFCTPKGRESRIGIRDPKSVKHRVLVWFSLGGWQWERPAGASAADILLRKACTDFVWNWYVCSWLNFNGRVSFHSKFSPIRRTSFFGSGGYSGRAFNCDCFPPPFQLTASPPRLLSLRRFPNLASFTHLSPIIDGWQVSDMGIDSLLELLSGSAEAGLPSKASLLMRINTEGEYRRSTLQIHLRPEGPTASHCIKHLVSVGVPCLRLARCPSALYPVLATFSLKIASTRL